MFIRTVIMLGLLGLTSIAPNHVRAEPVEECVLRNIGQAKTDVAAALVYRMCNQKNYNETWAGWCLVYWNGTDFSRGNTTHWGSTTPGWAVVRINSRKAGIGLPKELQKQKFIKAHAQELERMCPSLKGFDYMSDD